MDEWMTLRGNVQILPETSPMGKKHLGFLPDFPKKNPSSIDLSKVPLAVPSRPPIPPRNPHRRGPWV
jgi:hypothetical protein